MKKTNKLKTALVLLLLIIISLCTLSCENTHALVGAWELDRVISGEASYWPDREEYFSDGTALMIDHQLGQSQTFKWTTEGNRLLATFIDGSGAVYTYNISGSYLTITYGDMQAVYRKVG